MNDFYQQEAELIEALSIIFYLASKSMIHEKMDTVQLEQLGQGINF